LHLRGRTAVAADRPPIAWAAELPGEDIRDGGANRIAQLYARQCGVTLERTRVHLQRN
jgi:hypothetical protein